MICFLELIQKHNNEHYSDAQLNQYLEFAISDAQRMNHLIQDVLKFSQIKSRQAPPIPIDLNKVIQHVRQILDSMIVSQNAHFQVANLPTVLGDKVQLHQLFQHRL